MTAPPTTPSVLTIAGSDSSGGAGIQADLKTFAAFGVYGASVVTAVTAQNTQGVQGAFAIPADFVSLQLASVFGDLHVAATKTGMLANSAIIEAVANSLDAHCNAPIVVDPVMVATSGDRLLDGDSEAALKALLLPKATLLTPNLSEAAALLERAQANSETEMQAQGEALCALGPKAVLMKGGHHNADEAVDILVSVDGCQRFARPWVETDNTHGTGCTLSAAIAAGLAKGNALDEAIAAAKSYLWQALKNAQDLAIGHGSGPVDHSLGRR